MFSCSTTWEINHQKWTLKAARLERLPVLVLHTACDLGKSGKKWCNLASSKRKWAMPWLPCNVQQKWSSGCPAEWFGNWGSNKHRSCWLLTIDWDWSCGVPKMLCFPSQLIICWRELGVLMSEFCTTISWVCKRQNWSKPNRMNGAVGKTCDCNMFLNKYVCHFSCVWHHGQSTYIYISVWRIHKQTHAIHTCRMHTKLRKNTPKCPKFTTIFFCSMGVSNKTVMVSLGSIVANTTLKTWEPAITPPPSAPFMCVWLWDHIASADPVGSHPIKEIFEYPIHDFWTWASMVDFEGPNY